MKEQEIKKCCICGKEFSEWGNNPWPFKGEECCNVCDNHYVIPARIIGLQEGVLNKNHAVALLSVKKGADVVNHFLAATLKHLHQIRPHYVLIGEPITDTNGALLGVLPSKNAIAWAYRKMKSSKE